MCCPCCEPFYCEECDVDCIEACDCYTDEYWGNEDQDDD